MPASRGECPSVAQGSHPMATLKLDGDDLVVELSPLEQVGAIATGVRVPRSSVTAARMTDEPYAELRGIRVGTGISGK